MIGPVSKTPQPRHPYLSGTPSIHRTFESTRRFLWRPYQCCQAAPSGHPHSKDPLHRCHLLVPMGQQDVCLPQRTSSFHLQPGSHRHPVTYFGLIQCQVLPPRHLYHPVLPYRHEGKLLFPLCAACVEEEMPKRPLDRCAECVHTDQQRALTGTWCSPELDKAVELGYEVQYIYEVWHFDETCKGLFRDYVNTWLEDQARSQWVARRSQNRRTKTNLHPKSSYEHEGIQLEYDKIEYNPGLRTLAKTDAQFYVGQVWTTP